MILTDYYRLDDLKSATGKANKSHRLDCTASTGGYEPFEAIAARARGHRFYCYLNGVPETFAADAQRRADLALTCTKNISSVFVPDIERPYRAYGDVKGTTDALLIRLAEDYTGVELYVARGYKNNSKNLFRAWVDGELENDVATLQAMAQG